MPLHSLIAKMTLFSFFAAIFMFYTEFLQYLLNILLFYTDILYFKPLMSGEFVCDILLTDLDPPI